MRVEILTLFPDMFRALTGSGITSRAIERGLLTIGLNNPRDYAVDRHRTVDDKPYGGGPGMVMMVEPLAAALHAAKEQLTASAKVIYLSPQGAPLTQSRVERLSRQQDFVLVCGRYEGIDERFIDYYVDEEIAVGDFVVSGGELPAMMLLDAVIRQLPGALGSALSVEQDSYAQSGLLDFPHYTRPEQLNVEAVVSGADKVSGPNNEVSGTDNEQLSEAVQASFKASVPAVLLSGDHAAIARWRREQALERTLVRRPELLDRCDLVESDIALLKAMRARLDLD